MKGNPYQTNGFLLMTKDTQRQKKKKDSDHL